jgi:hypothetical protein
MSVSLAIGTVRTPEFPVVSEWYFIMIQVDQPRGEPMARYKEMWCMMGLPSNPAEKAECREPPLLQTDWSVWDDENQIAKGSNRLEAADMYTVDHMWKFLGQFPGEAGKKYVVEVKFKRDGSPLNVGNPRLIVIRVKYH